MVTARRQRPVHAALYRHQCQRQRPATSASICRAIRARWARSSMSPASMRRLAHCQPPPTCSEATIVRTTIRPGLNTSRGAYVNPSNFAGRAAAIFNNGANTPVSDARSARLSAIGRLRQSADGDGRERRREHASFLTSISVSARSALRMRVDPVGLLERLQRREDSGGNLVFEDQGNLLLWVAGVPTSLANLPAIGTATYTGHAIANIASGGSVGRQLSRRGRVLEHRRFRRPHRRGHDQRPGRRELHGHGHLIPITVTFTAR